MKPLVPALAVAVALSVGVGWTRYALLEPAPVAVLTPSAPATVNGARFGLVAATTLPTGEIPGTVTVRLDLTQEWAGGGELACTGWLISGKGSWRNRYTEQSACQNLEPGQRRSLVFSWQVPAGTVATEFQLRFGSDARLAIRP